MRRTLQFVLSLTVLLTFISSAQAEDPVSSAPVITMRVGVHPDFERIVFDWPHSVAYTVKRESDHVTIVFAAVGQVHFNSNAISNLTRAHDFSESADKDGHLLVSFNVTSKTALKDFTSDNSIAVDLTVGNATAPLPTTTQAMPAAAPSPKIAQTSVAVSAPEAKPPAESKPAAATSIEASLPQKAAIAPEPAPSPVAPASASTTVSAPVITAPEILSPVTKTPAATSANDTATPLKTTTVAVSSKPMLLPVDVTDTPLLIASLDPHTPIRAAIYQRANYGYIIFDRKLTFTIDALTSGQQPPRVTLEPIDLPKASGYRFALPPDTALRATIDGSVWKIFVTKQQPDVPVSTTLVAQPDFALGARFLLPLPDAPEPVRINDPAVNDDLILVPLAQTEAFSVARRMADFEILPAAQGLVIKPLTDKIIVRAVSDGIEITAEGGLHLSSATDTGASQQSSQRAKAAAAGKSLFDFSAWRGKPEENFTETRQRLQQTIVDVPEAERNRARLELARFYFANGYGEEASALLTWLAKLVPDLMAHADFIALSGASKILSYRADEGLKDLDTPLLKGQPEIDLWQAVGEAELRDWVDAEDKFSSTESMLGGYPEPFYSRFSILAIESALAVGKDREASDWLDRFENGQHNPNADAAIEYIHGVLHAKSGRAQAAEAAWKEVAASSDRLYKIRAEMALIDLGVSTNSITPAQAADRLEALRFGWRGDDLEVDILHRLGQFYIQAKNVKAGLNILAQAVALYPSSPMTPQIHTEMSGIFHDVFLGDLGKNLSPLDALTLYQQYRDLMPTGADGVSVTRNLAERLVAIDLLDQAADLLNDIVRNKLQGEDKARTDARLAGILLLDHKPQDALDALDLIPNNNLPDDLQNERALLRAKALTDLHRDDDALVLLKDNNRESAKMLRADIAMHAQHWNDAAKELLNLIGEPPKAGATLQPNQADWLVKCAIAYALANDQAGLDKLAVDYGAAMAGTPQNDTFRMLTQPEKSGQLPDIAAAQSHLSDVDMFQGFLDNYRKASDGSSAAPQK